MADDEDDIELDEADLDALTRDQKKQFEERVESEETFNPNDTIPSDHFSLVRERILEIEKSRALESAETLEEKCSFCGKEKREVKRLLQAETGAKICNECVLAYMKELNKHEGK